MRPALLSVVVTNQAGIARGLVREELSARYPPAVLQQLLGREQGAAIDGYLLIARTIRRRTVEQYRIACECRKPLPGLLLRGCRGTWALMWQRSWVIGDKSCDIELGRNAGARGSSGADGIRRDRAGAAS